MEDGQPTVGDGAATIYNTTATLPLILSLQIVPIFESGEVLQKCRLDWPSVGHVMALLVREWGQGTVPLSIAVVSASY